MRHKQQRDSDNNEIRTEVKQAEPGFAIVWILSSIVESCLVAGKFGCSASLPISLRLVVAFVAD